MSHRAIDSVVGVVAATLLVAGCGSGDQATGSVTSTIVSVSTAPGPTTTEAATVAEATVVTVTEAVSEDPTSAQPATESTDSASTESITPTSSSPSSSSPVPAGRPSISAPGVAGTAAAIAAVDTMSALPIKGRAAKTGYSREQFGAAWTDDVAVDGGHNGCDTRNDILRRDLTGPKIKPGSNGCSVLFGTLHDPYTGRSIAFVRGSSTSTAVQIDHVVSLSDAWQTGAQQLDASER